MFTYQAYGLIIGSDFELPELPTTIGTPDIIVQSIRDGAQPVAGMDVLWRIVEFNKKQVMIHLRDNGVFRIEDGRRIIMSLTDDVDIRTVRSFLLGNLMAITLYQRGVLALHASAVLINHEIIAFAGQSRTGKSSMAASFRARNHSVVSDDVVGIHLDGEKPIVYPGFPQLKLDPSAGEHLGIDPETLSDLNPEEKLKRALRVDESFHHSPAPLRHIYLLDIGETESIEQLSPSQAMICLIPHVFPTRMLQAADKADFEKLGQLVKRIPVFKLVRMPGLGRLLNHVETIEAHLRDQSIPTPA